MKKFTFSLDRILDYKDQLLDKEKSALMQLRGKMNRIEEEMESLDLQFDALNREMQAESRRGTTVPKLRCYEMQLDNIRQMKKQLERERKALSLEIECQLRVVVAASQEVTGLDKLKEKQLEEYSHAVAKMDETTIAEYVMTKLAARKEPLSIS